MRRALIAALATLALTITAAVATSTVNVIWFAVLGRAVLRTDAVSGELVGA
jgi:hypothetical protein